MKKLTTKTLLTFLLAVCAIFNSVTYANDLSVKIDNTAPLDTSCFAWFNYAKTGDGQFAFNDSSWTPDPIVAWHWSFGDGSTSTLQNPVHTYGKSIIGKVTVCLKVTTVFNISCTVCKEIEVRPDTNVCKADFNYSAMLSDDTTKVFFFDTSTGSSEVTWRRWSFPDSSQYNDSSFMHSFDPNLSSAYVCLTIGTASGCQASVCKNIPLKSCFADFSYTSQQNGTVNFYNRSMVIVSAARWYWNFGDGSYSNQLNPVHTYAPGITQAYVCLNINTMKDTCTICKTVNVLNAYDSCRADFSFQRVNIGSKTPQFKFTDISQTQSPTSWRLWTFPDSTTYKDSTFIHSFSAFETNAYVCLSISTASGCQSSVCKEIFINDTIYPINCKANFSYTIYNPDSISFSGVAPGTRVSFKDMSYSPDSINGWFWNFGDGLGSNLINPKHIYRFPHDTVVQVTLLIKSESGCMDTMTQWIYIPAIKRFYSMSGMVEGKNELLPQGIMVLYKKDDKGFFILNDANIINNGIFSFDHLTTGKYILYAMPHMYLSEKYFPTYYVNKLHWANATVIDLNSNIGGLTLKMVAAKIIEKGSGKISGSVINNNESTQLNSTRLKSLVSSLATPVYLYTPSNEVLAMSLTNENNTFSFEELPYGTYVLRIESLNLPDYETTITISPEQPETNDVVFDLNNPLGIKVPTQTAKLNVRNIDGNSIGIRISKGGEYTVSVVSLSGKTIVDGKINMISNSEQVIKIPSPKGIYILKLQNKTNAVVTKFIK